MTEPMLPGDDLAKGILSRPAKQFDDYPIEIRWEATRRHPYYLTFWREALLHRKGAAYDRPAEQQFRFAASLMLQAIGVGGEPVSPGKSFKELDPDGLHPAFLTGTVQPITMRSLFATMLRGLPRDERVVLGTFLRVSGDDNYAAAGQDDQAQIAAALERLALLPSPVLDSVPQTPLFYVHMGASQRSIVRDIGDQVRLWQARLGLNGSKVHKANLAEYLKVWDLREGWDGGGYDRSREKTFVQIAKDLKIKSNSTLTNQYRSAFKVITGHEFSPDLWWSLFGPLKYSALSGDPDEVLSSPIRREIRRRSKRDVPESTISPVSDDPHGTGMIEGKSATSSNIDMIDLLMDLRDLIARGFTDEQIAQELEIAAPNLVADFRERNNDLNSL